MTDKQHSLEWEVSGINSYTDSTQMVDDGKGSKRPARITQMTLTPQPDTAKGVYAQMQNNGSQIAGQPASQNIGSGALIMFFREPEQPFPYQVGDRMVFSPS